MKQFYAYEIEIDLDLRLVVVVHPSFHLRRHRPIVELADQHVVFFVDAFH
jgi:hypothetical protein